jgi:hypothetical protein
MMQSALCPRAPRGLATTTRTETFHDLWPADHPGNTNRLGRDGLQQKQRSLCAAYVVTNRHVSVGGRVSAGGGVRIRVKPSPTH